MHDKVEVEGVMHDKLLTRNHLVGRIAPFVGISSAQIREMCR